MSDERRSAERGGQMFIERESMIDSMLRLLWLNAFAELEPLPPEGENESENGKMREGEGVCMCERP